MDSLFGAASPLERSLQHCLDTLAIWNEVENASELTARYVSPLQLLGARLCWWVVRWGMCDVEMSAPAGLDVQHLIQSCLNLIFDSLHDLAISHGDTRIIMRMEAADTSGCPAISYASSREADMTLYKSQGGETSASQERQALNSPITETEEHVRRISDQIC